VFAGIKYLNLYYENKQVALFTTIKQSATFLIFSYNLSCYMEYLLCSAGKHMLTEINSLTPDCAMPIYIKEM
jgi:hypothetical protein